jgi:polyhydroxyalkanoate synthesis regulator phasin
MATDERMKILRMIEEGKISAEEGTRLLEALSKQSRKRPDQKEGEPRWLRVRVTEMDTGKESIRVNLPIGLVSVGLRMGARFVPDMEQEATMEELSDALEKGMMGKIVDIIDEEEGRRVELFIE